MMTTISSNSVIMKEDTDLSLSELTENSLMISKTQEITKLNTNNIRTNANNRGLYSNGLSTMVSSILKPAGESSEGDEIVSKSSSGSLPAALALPQADVGLLAASFPNSWNDWESKRRTEVIRHHEKFYWKKQNKLRALKRIKRKTVETKKVPSSVRFRHRRLRLERNVGRHLKPGCVACPAKEEKTVVPFQSSKSLRRRQRRRVVRFVDEEVTEWKRENSQTWFGLGKTAGASKTPFLEADRERKKNQRSLLDLQVGMKCMGL